MPNSKENWARLIPQDDIDLGKESHKGFAPSNCSQGKWFKSPRVISVDMAKASHLNSGVDDY